MIEQEREAWQAFVKGDPEPSKGVFSRGDDVVLANPWGPPACGWERVQATLDAAAERFREGELSSFEVLARYVTDELAVVFEVERGRAKVGGSQDFAPFALRVTTTYRLEDGDWKIVLRHADPIMAEKPSNAGLT
ncbi:MAG: YybH family protein [Planctomycetaceae bacterium]